MENNETCKKNEAVVETEHSVEWSLSKELAKSNRRMFIAWMVTLALWFATIVGFVWFLYQYDFVSETITVESMDGGNANYIGNDGDINNGKDYSEEKGENAQG